MQQHPLQRTRMTCIIVHYWKAVKLTEHNSLSFIKNRHLKQYQSTTAQNLLTSTLVSNEPCTYTAWYFSQCKKKNLDSCIIWSFPTNDNVSQYGTLPWLSPSELVFEWLADQKETLQTMLEGINRYKCSKWLYKFSVGSLYTQFVHREWKQNVDWDTCIYQLHLDAL